VVATGDIRKHLGELNAKIEHTNAALAELQKGTALKSVADKLEQLNTAIKTTDTTLADITKSIPQKGLGDKVETIGTSLKTISDKLANLQKDAPAGQITARIAQLETSIKSTDGKLAEIKQAIPADVTGPLTALSAQLKSVNDTVARLQQPFATASADRSAALSDVVGSLKSNIDEAATLRGKLAEQIASLQEAAKSSARPQPSDVVVVYVDLPDDSARPQTVATVSPLTVEFAKVGSTDVDGQGTMLAARLKDIIKERKNCTISVAGYADTMGKDDWNLTISKRRAKNVAEKLRTAFAGQAVQINEAGWGERRLKDWTPDESPNAMNRRVDVSVSCK
jgi:outer membrane protein OmpA-like peptidoglycan-associated protein